MDSEKLILGNHSKELINPQKLILAMNTEKLGLGIKFKELIPGIESETN